MDTTKPAPTLEQLRARVVNAFAELPTSAFDDLVYWFAPDGSQGYKLQYLTDPAYQVLKRAVTDYFAAKR